MMAVKIFPNPQSVEFDFCHGEMIHIICCGKTEQGYKTEEFFIPQSCFYDFIDHSGTFDTQGAISAIRDFFEGFGDVRQETYSKFVLRYPVNNVVFNTDWDFVESNFHAEPRLMSVAIGYHDSRANKDYSIEFLGTRIGRGYSLTPFEAFEPYLRRLNTDTEKECMTND